MNKPILINAIRTVRRGRADLTQQQLADAVGCARQTIVELEHQRYVPSLTLAMRICQVLEVSVEELFKLK